MVKIAESISSSLKTIKIAQALLVNHSVMISKGIRPCMFLKIIETFTLTHVIVVTCMHQFLGGWLTNLPRHTLSGLNTDNCFLNQQITWEDYLTSLERVTHRGWLAKAEHWNCTDQSQIRDSRPSMAISQTNLWKFVTVHSKFQLALGGS